MKQRIVYTFRNIAEAKQSELVSIVLERMTGNPLFESLQDDLVQLQSLYAEWQKAAGEAKNRDREKVLVKNEKRTACLDQLYLIAMKVNVLAANNEELAMATGLPLRQPRHKVLEIATPVIEKIKRLDKEGSVELMWKKVRGANTYAIEHSADGGQVWHNGTYCQAHRKRLDGFQPGVKTAFRVKAIGAEKESDWSDSVSLWMS